MYERDLRSIRISRPNFFYKARKEPKAHVQALNLEEVIADYVDGVNEYDQALENLVNNVQNHKQAIANYQNISVQYKQAKANVQQAAAHNERSKVNAEKMKHAYQISKAWHSLAAKTSSAAAFIISGVEKSGWYENLNPGDYDEMRGIDGIADLISTLKTYELISDDDLTEVTEPRQKEEDCN
ncbi:MAG: hypothetical protein M1820_007469 [Bogoriella megaspora]|nr:MAG: hypothetical protein M1820_007469 [Bogoriella megaspora]